MGAALAAIATPYTVAAKAAPTKGEGTCIEFKSSFQKEVIEALAAFANTKGGAVLVGVSDVGEIVGVTVQAETMQSWINQCKQIASPRIIHDIELVQIEDKTVAVVSISEYPLKQTAQHINSASLKSKFSTSMQE